MKELFEKLNLKPNTSIRIDCPICFNRNTFSAFHDGNNILYNCFHADCDTRGVSREKLSKEVFKRKEKIITEKEEEKFFVPPDWESAKFNVDSINYLRKSKSYDAMNLGLADIRYDKKLARTVFLVKDENGNIVDAVGRSINGMKPKWYRYGKSRYPFICGTSKTAIIVEDCASACALSRFSTGIALLGTSLLQKHIDLIKQYDRVGVALDRDATQKATAICDELNLVMNTKFLILEDDIKNMDYDDIKNLVDKVNKKAWGWMNDTNTSSKHL
jgi:DNA primase